MSRFALFSRRARAAAQRHVVLLNPAVYRTLTTWLADAWAGESIGGPETVAAFALKHYAQEDV